MWNTKIEYFEELCEKQQFIKINLHHTDRICTGYIQVVNDDGIFVSTKMGDDQKIGVENVKFILYSAISFVECGL